MADPTRAQFDAASRKVAQSAPEGLSKDQFYALVDKEIARDSSGVPAGTLAMGQRSAATNGMSEEAFNQPPSPTMEALGHAAHPEGLGDILSLLIPSGVAESAGAATHMLKQGYDYAREASAPKLLKNVSAKMRGFVRGMADDAVVSPSRARGLDARMPNTSAYEVTNNAGQTTGKVTIGVPDASILQRGGVVGKLTGNKAKTSDGAISDALQELLGRSKSEAGTLPPETSMTKGGNPATTGARYDEIVSQAQNAPAQSKFTPTTPKPGMEPRIVKGGGSIPTSLEDALSSELSGLVGEKPMPSHSTGAPPITQTALGSPSTTAARYDEILAQAENAPARSKEFRPVSSHTGTEVDPIEAAIASGQLPESARGKIVDVQPGAARGGVRLTKDQAVGDALSRQLGSDPTKTPMTAGGSPAARPSPPQGQAPLDLLTKPVGKMSTEEMATIRRHYGSVKAGQLLGISPEDVVKLSGGGPSRVPIEAEERIRLANSASDLQK